MSRHISSSAQPITVYYHKYRAVFLISGSFFFCLASYSVRMGNLFFSFFLLLNVLWMLMLAQGLRIVVSPAGIAYHNVGFYTIESVWLNVERIVTVPTFLGPIQCLMLRQPSVRGWTGLAWLIHAKDRGRTIPLSDGWARRDQLEQQIRQYAPHVLD